MKQIAITFAIAVTAAGTNVAPGKESVETMDRFVVLARNDTQPKGHAPVLVFEYRPGEDALAKRAEMEASSWSPDRMFDSGSFDGFLRHQVDHPGNPPRKADARPKWDACNTRHADRQPRSHFTNHKSQITNHKSQITNHKS